MISADAQIYIRTYLQTRKPQSNLRTSRLRARRAQLAGKNILALPPAHEIIYQVFPRLLFYMQVTSRWVEACLDITLRQYWSDDLPLYLYSSCSGVGYPFTTGLAGLNLCSKTNRVDL